MSNVLVTGSSGFISSHLVPELLKQGHKVFGIDLHDNHLIKRHENFKFYKQDVFHLTAANLVNFNIDYVFHLAFVTNIPHSIDFPTETVEQNIEMSAYALEISKQAKVKKFLFASTASLYGDNPTPWKEDMKPYPIEPYSVQKLTIEYYCKLYAKLYGLKTAIFRFYQVFGENQRNDTALYKFFQAVKEDKPITLTQTTAQSTFSTGQRDFIYAGDLAEACIEAAITPRTGRGEILNIASGKVYTMKEIAEALGAKIEFIPKRGYEVERHEADMTNTFDLLSWRPKTDVIEWLKEYRKVLVK